MSDNDHNQGDVLSQEELQQMSKWTRDDFKSRGLIELQSHFSALLATIRRRDKTISDWIGIVEGHKIENLKLSEVNNRQYAEIERLNNELRKYEDLSQTVISQDVEIERLRQVLERISHSSSIDAPWSIARETLQGGEHA